MGEALLAGIVRRSGPGDVVVCERSAERGAELAERYGVDLADLPGAAARARVVLLAVKPQDVDGLLGLLAAHLDRDHLVVSVAAGVTTARIEAAQGPEIGRLRGFLADWGAAPAADHHGGHGDMAGMAGMMSDEQMAALGRASGAASTPNSRPP